MHPLRKLRESGNATPAQVSALLAEDVVFNSPILVRPIEGREPIAAIFAQSGSTRGSGTYTTEFKLDERTTFLRWVGTIEGHKLDRSGTSPGRSVRRTTRSRDGRGGRARRGLPGHRGPPGSRPKQRSTRDADEGSTGSDAAVSETGAVWSEEVHDESLSGRVGAARKASSSGRTTRHRGREQPANCRENGTHLLRSFVAPVTVPHRNDLAHPRRIRS
jgi:hypothetical protein